MDKDTEGSNTERPSVLFVRQMLQEKPSRTLECNVSQDRRNPLELWRQRVESSRAIGSPLGNILYDPSQYLQRLRRWSKPTRRILVDDVLEFIVTCF